MMRKIIIFILMLSFYCIINTSTVQAVNCNINDPKSDEICNNLIPGQACELDPKNPNRPDLAFCQDNPFKSNFGKIQPPDPLKGFLAKDPTGAFGISQFLSNLITLIYSIAAIVLIFMLLWGAFEWMTSGGDKEKIESARRRIISAIIGIILFAIAFAVIQILGVFTGFKFFVGQV